MDSKSGVESVVSSRGGRMIQLGGPRWKINIHEGLFVLRAGKGEGLDPNRNRRRSRLWVGSG
jgi:hypothetical protein